MFRSLCKSSIVLSSAALVAAAQAAGSAVDSATIEAVTGLKGTYNQKENVFKVSKPRDDVKVTVERWSMPPFMGLTSWAAFTPIGKSTMVMGDTVLLEDEVNPALSAALDAGLEVTALHNHFFYEQPRVFFMHIGGMGDARQLATAVKALYDRIAQVRSSQATPAGAFPGDIPSTNSISPGPIEAVFGTKVQANNGMAKVVVGRKAAMHGTTVGNEMGVNTWAAFAGTDEQAVVDGDFAMLESELQTVLRTLRGEGINIVAIHQHMTQEKPRYMFLHYWGKGKAVDLARAVKKALDTQHLGA
jgi:hypothetical protein